MMRTNEGLERAKRSYYHALNRCTNPKCDKWKDYGGRGIKFRFHSFEEFFAELGLRPKGKILDRKDNDGHYESGNVRWATWSEQRLNRRPIHVIEVLCVWCKKTFKARTKKAKYCSGAHKQAFYRSEGYAS